MTDQTAKPAADHKAADPKTDAPKPGSPEYEAAMAEKGRSARGDAPQADDKTNKAARPDNVPEKFWNAETGAVDTEKLLKSYQELESGRGKADDKAPSSGASPEVKDAVEKAGLDFTTLYDKVAQNGTIEDADFAALEKAGIPRAMAERHIQLEKYRFEQEQREAIAYAGGEDATKKLLSWAGENLSKDEIAGYEDMLAGPNWRVAIDTLKTKMAGASPTRDEPNLVTTSGSSGPSGIGYVDEASYKAAMRDRRYFLPTPEGEAYRQEVFRKYAASGWRKK